MPEPRLLHTILRERPCESVNLARTGHEVLVNRKGLHDAASARDDRGLRSQSLGSFVRGGGFRVSPSDAAQRR